MREKKTPLQRARARYEETGRGPVVMRVQLCKTDDPEVWERIKQGLVERYGSAKDGIYQLAKKEKII